LNGERCQSAHQVEQLPDLESFAEHGVAAPRLARRSPMILVALLDELVGGIPYSRKQLALWAVAID